MHRSNSVRRLAPVAMFSLALLALFTTFRSVESCSFLVTSAKLPSKESAEFDYINHFLRKRGPDFTNVKLHNGITFVHNLLSMTGVFTPQPFISKSESTIALFNGEIYNYKEFGEYDSDGECLIPLYEEHGESFFSKLDGEFAIVLFDFANNLVFVCSDTFGTKPLWIAKRGGVFSISSYKSAIERIGIKEKYIEHVRANTVFRYRLQGTVLEKESEKNLYDFDLSQHKSSTLDWEDAFERAIKKRTVGVKHPIFIGLSSGYDSGAIALGLCKLKFKHHAHSILGLENNEIILSRHRWCPKTENASILKEDEESGSLIFHKRHFSENVEPLVLRVPKWHQNYRTLNTPKPYGYEQWNLYNDGGGIGISQICKEARRQGQLAYLSGAGADEIYSDYGWNGKRLAFWSTFGGKFPENLEDIYPWPSFYDGPMRAYLMKEEHIAGSWGIEGRYPFLDREAVQEFLWLKSEVKNKVYKSCIHLYLKLHGYPFLEGGKVGFVPTTKNCTVSERDVGKAFASSCGSRVANNEHISARIEAEVFEKQLRRNIGYKNVRQSRRNRMGPKVRMGFDLTAIVLIMYILVRRGRRRRLKDGLKAKKLRVKIRWTFAFALIFLTFYSLFLRNPLPMSKIRSSGQKETNKLLKECEQKHLTNWLGYSPIKYPPPTLGPITASPNVISSHSKQNMIIGMAAGYGLDILRPFLDSILYSKVDAEIVLLGMAQSKDDTLLFNQDVQDFARVHGITLKVIEVDELKKIRNFCVERGIRASHFDTLPFNILRRFLYEYFLFTSESRLMQKRTGWILLTDIKDAIFQGDLFSHYDEVKVDKTSALFLYAEGHPEPAPFLDVRWNRNGVRACYSGEATNILFKHDMKIYNLCGGTVIGKYTAIKTYLRVFRNEVARISAALSREKKNAFNKNCRDQVIHNFVHWTGLLNNNHLNVHIESNLNGPVGTLGLYGCVFKTDKFGRVTNWQGIPFLYVHQYYQQNANICKQGVIANAYGGILPKGPPHLNDLENSAPFLHQSESLVTNAACKKLVNSKFQRPRRHLVNLDAPYTFESSTGIKYAEHEEEAKLIVGTSTSNDSTYGVLQFFFSARKVCSSCRIIHVTASRGKGGSSVPHDKYLQTLGISTYRFDSEYMRSFSGGKYKNFSSSSEEILVWVGLHSILLSNNKIKMIVIINAARAWIQSNPFDYFKNHPALNATSSLDVSHEDEQSTFSQSTTTDRASCLASGSILLGHSSSIMNFFKLLLSDLSSSQKEAKLYRFERGNVESSLAPMRVLNRTLKKFPCHAEEKYSAVFAAEIGTDACKYGVDAKNRVVNYQNNPISVVFDFWFFLPSICEQFYS